MVLIWLVTAALARHSLSRESVKALSLPVGRTVLSVASKLAAEVEAVEAVAVASTWYLSRYTWLLRMYAVLS